MATIPVRMGSERLPGKSMRLFGGRPLLWHLINRVRQCIHLDDVIVATPDSHENDPIETFCILESIRCYRGVEEDVLVRLIDSLRACEADIGVVVYGDNPLVDPRIVDEHIALFCSLTDYDWIGNDLKTTFPPGMEVEVFNVSTLINSEKQTKDPLMREHATLGIRQRPDLYKLFNVEADGVRRRPEIHLGVDTGLDAEVVEAIINHFADSTYYSLEQIIEYVDLYPDLLKKNYDLPRRWRKYRQS